MGPFVCVPGFRSAFAERGRRRSRTHIRPLSHACLVAHSLRNFPQNLPNPVSRERGRCSAGSPFPAGWRCRARGRQRGARPACDGRNGLAGRKRPVDGASDERDSTRAAQHTYRIERRRGDRRLRRMALIARRSCPSASSRVCGCSRTLLCSRYMQWPLWSVACCRQVPSVGRGGGGGGGARARVYQTDRHATAHTFTSTSVRRSFATSRCWSDRL